MFRTLTVGAEGAVVESSDVSPPPAGSIRWIDLVAQDEASMKQLDAFNFHPLAIEDALTADQRPKLEEYGEYLFIVTHALRCVQRDPRDVAVDELHAFLGKGYLVTVHLAPIEALDVVWKRAQGDAALMRHGADFLYYLVADNIVDSHFSNLDLLNDKLEDIEERVLDKSHRKDLEDIFSLKHSLVLMRKLLSPQRDVFGVLTRRGNDFVSDHNALYFRDVYDHLVRIYESIDSARDLLGNAMEAYLSMVAQRTNDIMKSLTLLSAVFLPLTFLTGFFGQNFEGMPFKSNALMWCVVAACGIIPVGMLLWFRRRHWL